MKLRTYSILALVALVIVGMWLCPKETSEFLFVLMAFGSVFVFYYAIMRLFWAIVHRIER